MRGRLRGQETAERLAVGQHPAAPRLGHQHGLGEVVVGRPRAVLPLAETQRVPRGGGGRGLGRSTALLGYQGPQLLMK